MWWRFLINRVAYGILVLIGVASLVFFLFTILPGDPARMMLGQRADISSVEAINKELGRDKPLITQYVLFLNDVSPLSLAQVTNDKKSFYFDSAKYGASFSVTPTIFDWKLVVKKPYLRNSYQSKKAVTAILAEAFPKTLLLAFVSMSFALIAGMFLGISSTLIDKKWFDKLLFAISTLGMSLPSFFAAMLIAWFFAFLLGEYTGLSLFGSLYEVDDFGTGKHLALQNLILPAFTLGIRPLAIIIDLTKSSLSDTLSNDFIRTAKAKGLNTWQILWRHALKNALNPIITTISGWFASLLAGAVFVEYVFDWKGMGLVIVNAIEKYDFPVLMGAVLFIACLLVLVNFLVDISYRIIDPRIKLA
ncbi:MAG: ABC transporter permease [Bacteroidales bacterium]|nr:ABC transporter permease [Bacteroidales bacterium]